MVRWDLSSSHIEGLSCYVICPLSCPCIYQYNKISCLICSLFKIPLPTPRPLYRDIQILKRTVNSVKPWDYIQKKIF